MSVSAPEQYVIDTTNLARAHFIIGINTAVTVARASNQKWKELRKRAPE